MKKIIFGLTFFALFLLGTTALASPTYFHAVNTPKYALAKCKDGTYSFSHTHTGSCSHHKGVSYWINW